MGTCEYCGREVEYSLGYTCNECGQYYCSDHRLPENHDCVGSMDDDAVVIDATAGADPEVSGPVQTRHLTDNDRYTGKVGDKLPGFAGVMILLAVVILGYGISAAGVSVTLPDVGTGGNGAAAANATATATPTPDASTPTATQTPKPLSERRVGKLIHQQVNAVRHQRGLNNLSWDQNLFAIADSHSTDMGQQQYLSHTQPDGDTREDRYAKFGYECRVQTDGNRYLTGGENLAKTYYQVNLAGVSGDDYYSTPEELAKGVVRQWLNSAAHRKNLLRPAWKREGIGVFIGEANGQTVVYVTQNFC